MPAAEAARRAEDARQVSTVDMPPVDESLLSSLAPGARRRVAVAVSGGGDSMALLMLARAWRETRAGGPEVVALTVDHGLRAGSAAEAAWVADFCARRGIAHRSLVWEGEKPSSGVSAAARRARHDLLAGAAQALGTDIVLTGHTFDDQAETIHMRAVRGGERGMAGIAPATLVNGAVWFVRPLLGTRRDALRGYLGARRVGWMDDPSNEDTRFERVRTRKSLSEERKAELVRAGAGAADRRRELGHGAARVIDRYASSPAEGVIALDPAFASADPAAGLYALRILLALAGGRDHPVDEARAAALLERLSAPERFRAVLSHALIEKRATTIYLYREARNLPSIATRQDTPVVWDGRYRVTARAGLPFQIGAAGGGCEAAERPAGVPARVFNGARAAQPALWYGQCADSAKRVALPTRAQDVERLPVLSPWAAHLPSFDLELARAASRLIDAGPLPYPPLVGHIAS